LGNHRLKKYLERGYVSFQEYLKKKQRHFYEASKFQYLSFPWRCSSGVASTLDGKPRFNVQLTPPVFVPVPIWLCKTVTGNGFCQQGMDLRTAQKEEQKLVESS